MPCQRTMVKFTLQSIVCAENHNIYSERLKSSKSSFSFIDWTWIKKTFSGFQKLHFFTSSFELKFKSITDHFIDKLNYAFKRLKRNERTKNIDRMKEKKEKEKEKNFLKRRKICTRDKRRLLWFLLFVKFFCAGCNERVSVHARRQNDFMVNDDVQQQQWKKKHNTGDVKIVKAWPCSFVHKSDNEMLFIAIIAIHRNSDFSGGW